MPRSRVQRDSLRRSNGPDITTAVGYLIATWSLALARYFFVDNENGDDTKQGYIDAAAGTVFAAGVGAALAIKTIDRLYEIFPRVGEGRTAVILLKGRSTGTYLSRTGVAAALLLRGIVGYYRLVIRGSSDFTNSAADRIKCGERTATGFSSGGYNITTLSGSISAVTNATPVQITTGAAHGLTTGDEVTIASVGGQPSANGEYIVDVIDATNFTLRNTRIVSGEAYTAGGTFTAYQFTEVGGGIPVFPALGASLGFRLRFDENTQTVALRNTCYEIFTIGNRTVIPARFFAAAPNVADIVYIEEAGAKFQNVEISFTGGCDVAGINSATSIVIQGTDGQPNFSNFSSGSFSMAFTQSGTFGVGGLTGTLVYGPFRQVSIANTYRTETDSTVICGGNRANAFGHRDLTIFIRLYSMSFGTNAQDQHLNLSQVSVFASCNITRGIDFVNCGPGSAAFPLPNLNGSIVGKNNVASFRRNRFNGSIHGGSIALTSSSMMLRGNFFNGVATNCVQLNGSGISATVDDCIGASSSDSAGVSVTNGQFCNIAVGLTAPSSIGGSAGKEIVGYGGTLITYATLRATNPVVDGAWNRYLGLAPFTALVIV